ncbi:helicase-exonuclease AddAB subunit AddA [Ectobacillus funiculus]|uniref:helicase-exonuclease AddAB subunit AddA n=1 Tax=Ectobacillus funiculus TaxID=137993 RepID=UPI00101C3604|nr:helicase-exonuclease AddAB subunit AddA [Ectobacillus funiculus]
MIDSILAKPPNSQWTDDQWKAIAASGRDILVAAAAGSGKTAVLVERIIRKIISPDNPIDVDRLLVVTFTNASAQEMKNRIGEALDKELTNDPSSQHLRRQLSLLSRASISTIHSFCLQVIRTYYYMLDIDPSFRIANETEIELLKEEVMNDILEEEYGLDGNEAFFDLVDRYTGDRSDSDLQDMILKLYTEAGAHPNPEKWLDKLVAFYDVEGKSIDDLPYTQYLLQDVILRLEGAKQYTQKAIRLSQLPDGPAPKIEAFESDLSLLERLLAAAHTSWQTLYGAMQEIEWKTFKRIKKADYNADLIEKADKLRKKVKDDIGKLQEELFSRLPENYVKDLSRMHYVLQTLIHLVKEFSVRFQAVKREKSMVDFTDLEHLCLAVLAEDTAAEELRPSAVALQYRDKFAEVLIDEYQDVNFVQESILRLVTKETEAAGNLFMVGDVKQSVYRFRLAEPGLFLGKYRRFTPDGMHGGMRIDLAKNFRSRSEVLDGTNFVFKQIMGEAVGDLDYDKDAELKLGAAYPEGADTAAEFLIVNQNTKETAGGEEADAEEAMDLEAAQMEARLIAARIKEMVSSGYEVYDRKHNAMRPVSYRDFVILLRSMTTAPQMTEEFKRSGIPVYAELSSGYFEATEVSVMLNVLRVIDNPAQDIPLAAVLRSPLVGATDEELAVLRIHAKKGSFYQAMRSFLQAERDGSAALRKKLSSFFDNVQRWRSFATQQPLSDLIWKVYRETGYYDFVSGLPGGKQRQANLRVLYDRARQYEATSFRGLFRFLRFIERILERGDDMGTARALGEQEDVVRIMTIHKSKGLEFPVVFVAGLGRRFNMQDLNKKFLLHKDLGFGSPFIDPQKRIKYATISQIAIKRKMKMELIAEEMRVLYVALTRAKEKLILIGTVKDASAALSKWTEARDYDAWLLPDHMRAQAASYIDWLGPALMRHKGSISMEEALGASIPAEIYEYPASWAMRQIEAADLREEQQLQEEKQELVQALYEQRTAPVETEKKDEVTQILTWQYSFEAATTHRAKQSVSEIKRNYQADEESDTAFLSGFRSQIEKRPRFMERKGLTPAERGTAVHAVMQHVDWTKPVTELSIQEQLADMVNKELLTYEQAESIVVEEIVAFFQTQLGKRTMQAELAEREVPFMMMIPASSAYQDWHGEDEELVLVQGIIDCLIEEPDGIILIDFKTDSISERFPGGFEQARPVLENRYRLQLEMYSQALEKSYGKRVKEKYLYFFDGSHILEI